MKETVEYIIETLLRAGVPNETIGRAFKEAATIRRYEREMHSP